MRPVICVLVSSFLVAMPGLLGAVEPVVVRVALDLDTYLSFPADQLAHEDKSFAVVEVDKQERIRADVLERRVRVCGMGLGEARLKVTTLDGKTHVFQVQVVEKLDESIRKELSLRQGDDLFLDMPSNFRADGPTRSFIGSTNLRIDFHVVNSRRLQLTGREPGLGGLTFINAQDVMTAYRVKILPADAPPPEKVDKTPITLFLGECRLVSLPKGFDLSEQNLRPQVLPGLADVVSGLIYNDTHFLVCGHRPTATDISLVDAKNGLYRYRATVREEKIEFPDKKGEFESLTFNKMRVPLKGSETIALTPRDDWDVYKSRDELQKDSPHGFGPQQAYLRAANPSIVRLQIDREKCTIHGVKSGVTDIVVVKQNKCEAIYRVKVE